MPGIEGEPPTGEQVSTIRQKFQDYITENGRGIQNGKLLYQLSFVLIPGEKISPPGLPP